MKAQVSMELLIIISFVAVLSLAFILVFKMQSDSAQDQIITNQAQQIASRISDSAESVYYLGEPSKTTLKVYIPSKVENITLGNREIVFFVRTRTGINEIVQYVPINISGSIPAASGLRQIVIESKGSYVWVHT